jgi:hypothetical protein
MTTTARIKANRKNAKKSTGPRTQAGKAAACLNALKHGMCAQTGVLAHESAEAFERFRDEVRALAPEGADHVAVELAADAAASSAARLIRCDKVALERIEQRVRHAADGFDRTQHDRADKLGKTLLWEPTARGNHHVNDDDYASERFEAREAIDTRAVWRELQSFAHGVDWLLAWWETLGETLESFGAWYDNEAYIACRLLGRDPERATDDPVVAGVVTASRVAHCQRGGPVAPYALVGSVLDGFNDARRQATNYPVTRERVETRFEQFGIVTKEQAQVILRLVVERETARLRALKAGKLDGLAALDRKSAVVLAEFDDTPTGLLIRRYTTANRREMRQALLDVQNAEPAAEPETETETETKTETETETETEVAPESEPVGFVPSTAPPAPSPAPEGPSVRAETGSAIVPRPHHELPVRIRMVQG